MRENLTTVSIFEKIFGLLKLNQHVSHPILFSILILSTVVLLIFLLISLFRNKNHLSKLSDKDLMIGNLLKSIPGGVVIYRFTDRLETVFFSDGAAKLIGYTREEYSEITKKDTSAIMHEDDRKRLLDYIYTTLSARQTVNVSFRVLTKSGEIKWVQFSGTPVKKENDAIIVYGIYQGTSPETLLYRKLLDDSSNGCYVCDTQNYELLYINEAGKTQFANGQEPIGGQKCYEYLFGYSSPCPDCDMYQLAKTSFRTQRYAFPHTETTYYLRGKLMDWNSITAHIEFVEDVTAQKREEDRMTELVTRFSDIFDNVQGGLCLYRWEKGKITALIRNQAFYTIYGRAKENCSDNVDTVLLDVHPDDLDEVRRLIQHFFANGGHMQHTLRFFSYKKNQYLWIYVDAVIQRQDNGICFAYVNYTDVSAQKEVEQALLESELKYQLAVSSAGLEILEYDIISDVLVVFSPSKDPTSLQRSVVKKYSSYLTDHKKLRKDSIVSFHRLIEQLRRGDENVSTDLWNTYSQDSPEYRCSRICFSRTLCINGIPTKAFGYCKDVTFEKESVERYERARAYQEMAKQTDFFSVHLNITKNVLIEYKSQYEVLNCDLAKCYSATDFFNFVRERIPFDEMRQDFEENFDEESIIQQFLMGKYSNSLDLALSMRNITMWLKVNYYLMKSPDTNEIFAFISVSDTTTEKMISEIMHTVIKTEYEYMIFVDASKDTAIFYSYSTGITNNFRENIPYEEQLLPTISKNVTNRLEFLHFLSVENILNQLDSKENCFFFFKEETKERGVRYKLLRFTYIYPNQKGFLIICTDTTDMQKEKEQITIQLKQALMKAENAMRSKTLFFSRVSHDLRTPLNGILGMTYLAMRGQNIPTETKNCLEKIDQSGKFMLALVNDVLELSKLENHQTKVELVPYTFEEFLKDLHSIIDPLCQQKNQTFIEPQVDNPITLFIDKIRCNRVVTNILANAVEYTPEGGTIEFKTQVEQANCNTAMVNFSIQDNGIGISEDFLPYIFEPFAQENPKNSFEKAGTGLGLSIAKQMLDLMGGTITVESKLGKGTCFYISCPCRIASQELLSVPKEEQNEEPLHLNEKQILLCDDFELNAEIVSALLETQGSTITWAENGKIGLKLFEQSDLNFYDIILMDMQMPVMDGCTATREIRKLNRVDAQTIPIVAMTANAFEEDVKKCLDSGMDAHMAKPLNMRTFFPTLSEWIEKGHVTN